MENFQFKIDYDYKSRLTLIIDGNWLLISRLAVLRNKYNTVDELFPILKENMIKSVAIVVNQIKCIDNVIFVADGGSWRKRIEQPKVLVEDNEEDSYKGTRSKSADFDWDKFFTEYNNFIEELSTVGHVNIFKAHGVEGDDWCWYLSNALYKSGTNCLIMSADKDLTQLVKFDPVSFNFVMTYYKVKSTKHLITYDKTIDNYKDQISMSFFLDQDKIHNYDCIGACLGIATDKKGIDPKAVVVDKIFRGDVSDNVLAPIKYTSGSKTYKITAKQLDFGLNINSDEELKAFINRTIDNNPKYSSLNKEAVLEHALYNRKLVYLDQGEYPQEILEKMQENAYYTCSTNLDTELSYIRSQKNNLTEFLDIL